MNGATHEQIRQELGVYVLGALEPAERDRVERHVSGCALCREELAELAVLPSLLQRLGHHPEAATPPPPPFAPIARRMGAERRRARRRQVVLAAAAALCVVVAAVTVTLGPVRQAPPAGSAFVASAEDVAATATLEPKRWGMAMHLVITDLPERRGYAAFAVAEDGHRTQVATWHRIEGTATITGACYLRPDEVVALEIVGAGEDEVLALLQPG